MQFEIIQRKLSHAEPPVFPFRFLGIPYRHQVFTVCTPIFIICFYKQCCGSRPFLSGSRSDFPLRYMPLWIQIWILLYKVKNIKYRTYISDDDTTLLLMLSFFSFRVRSYLKENLINPNSTAICRIMIRFC